MHQPPVLWFPLGTQCETGEMDTASSDALFFMAGSLDVGTPESAMPCGLDTSLDFSSKTGSQATSCKSRGEILGVCQKGPSL